MSSVIDTIYEQINAVIGGNDPNQFFTLLLPGTILKADDYAPPTIKSDIDLRSSLLANALYDVCQVAGTPNGNQLPDQLARALGVLVTKLDPELEKTRRALRDALSKPTEYAMPDGSKFAGTKIELLSRLMDIYNRAVNEWATAQATEQETLKKQYPADTPARQEAFNQWYATHSVAYEGQISQAYDRTTMVLSPDEQEMISSILDSGDSGVKAAKAALRNARTHYPDGDAYKVLFTPSDWPTLLQSEFGYIDLLASPEHLADQIALQQELLSTQLTELDAMSSMIPKDLQSVQDQVTQAKQAYDSAQQKIVDTYAASAATAVKIYLSKKDQKAGKERTDAVNGLTSELKKGTPDGDADKSKTGGSGTLTDQDITKLVDGQTAVNDAQTKLRSASEAYADAALKLISGQAQYTNLEPYYRKVKAASEQLDALRKQLDVASNRNPDTVSRIFPNSQSDRFTQLQVDFTQSDLSDTSSLSSSFSQTSWSVDLFFGSASGSSSSAESKFTHDVINSGMKISIGLLLAKVEVDRPWFKPGVFLSTRDMFTLSRSRISSGPLQPGKFGQARDNILPTYPTAFVIAKDITIKLEMNAGMMHQAQSALDKHESAGGGFLCFSVSHSSAEHSEQKAFTSHVQGTSVVIRIPGAQIIGWYQQFVPEDVSTPIKDGGDAMVDNFIAQFGAMKLQGAAFSRALLRTG